MVDQKIPWKLKYMTKNEPKTQTLTMSVVARLRPHPSASWKKASDGWYIEIELVIAARKSMKNQIAPIGLPIQPICAKMTGSVVRNHSAESDFE
jgi:hypothetical protein